jgi:PelA/Pel-15E family pectate lyase
MKAALIACLFAASASAQSGELLTADRIARHAPEKRVAWDVYLRRSRDLYNADTATMGRELRAAKQPKMTKAPYAHDFALTDSMPAVWFASAEARRMADVIVSFQAPNGGWSKHIDFRQHTRRPGESFFGESDRWEWISTIDNFSTTEEIAFLGKVNGAQRDARYEGAIARGIDYLVDAQYPNGCFPQIYPLQGGYHDAATFNDDATVHVLGLLRAVSNGAYRSVTSTYRRRAAAAVTAGVACILATQVRVGGELTAWGQQHDPLTLQPTTGRSYELTSLAALETASIADLLMSIRSPTPRIVAAVDAAVRWLQSVAVTGYTYSNYELRKTAGAGPIWGRLYEIGTNRVIMADRNGVKVYDWNKLTDRRSGYRWYVAEPARTIAMYETWKSSRAK